MTERKPAGAIGDTFEVGIDEIEIDIEANTRIRYDERRLRELAESINACGLIHPVTVWWTGERYRVIAGFRRALAMCRFRDLGFETIRVTLAHEDDAELIRAAENIRRKNLSLYETCRYLYELRHGRSERRRFQTRQIARAIGKSRRYVRMLVRFYRVLPPTAHTAWAANPDLFPIAVVAELTDLADAGDVQALELALDRLLRRDGEPVHRNASARRTRAMTRRPILALAARLAEAADAATEINPTASVAHRLLVAIGNRDTATAERIVEELRAGVGS